MEVVPGGSGGGGGNTNTGDSTTNLIDSSNSGLFRERGDSSSGRNLLLYGSSHPGITTITPSGNNNQVEIMFRQRVDVDESSRGQQQQYFSKPTINGMFCGGGIVSTTTTVHPGPKMMLKKMISDGNLVFDEPQKDNVTNKVYSSRVGDGGGVTFTASFYPKKVSDGSGRIYKKFDKYNTNKETEEFRQEVQDSLDKLRMATTDNSSSGTDKLQKNTHSSIIRTNSSSSTISSSSVITPSPSTSLVFEAFVYRPDEADPKLDELVQKILRCDKCPHVKLSNFNESFAHHQHHHGLKFCPVCFELVNCHEEFVQEHLKSCHMINDEGDVSCPVCSIPIHHILCFDHIKKDHLKGYYEQYDAKPVVRRTNGPVVVNPPESFKIPRALLAKKSPSHNEEGQLGLLGSNLGSNNIAAGHREPIKHIAAATTGFTRREKLLSMKKKSSASISLEEGSNKKVAKNKLTDLQTEILDNFFETNKHPSLVDKMELARSCNLPVHTISAWFGNRRRLRINWDKISEHKKARLLRAYERNARPTHAEIKVLCSELGFNHTQVSAWFKTRLLNKQNLWKRQKINSHLSAKRRVTEMLKAKLASSDSDSTDSDGGDNNVDKTALNYLDSQERDKSIPILGTDPVCDSLPSLGVDEKLSKVQDWINHIAESNVIPDSPDELLEPQADDKTTPDATEANSKTLETTSSKDRPSPSPSPPVLTRPCSPPFHGNNLQSTESAQNPRSLSPVAPILTAQTTAAHRQLKPGQQFSFETRQVLRECFKTTQFLTEKEKRALAEKVGATRERIANWFQLERSRFKTFLTRSKDLTSQVRSDLLAQHRRMENINLEDIYDKCLNFFTRGNCFANSQEMKLIKKFSENMHPDAIQISIIAKEVNASREKVSQWFTNRFQRLRRGKLPGYDLKGGRLIRLGTDTMYSEIKIEPEEASSYIQSNILHPDHSSKRESRPAVPTLQWSRVKESPLTAVIKQEFPEIELRNIRLDRPNLCLSQIIDNRKRLVVKVRNLPISPGTIVKVRDSELDMFERTFKSKIGSDTPLLTPEKSPGVEVETPTKRQRGRPRKYPKPDPPPELHPPSDLNPTSEPNSPPELDPPPSESEPNPLPETLSSGNSTKSINRINPRHFSPHQKKLLEELYSKNDFPTNAEIKVLAEKIELNELQVNRWFTYKRFLVRRAEVRKRKQFLINSKTLRKSTRKLSASVELPENSSPTTNRRFKKRIITNRCKGFLESQRKVLWSSFEKCDHPNQDIIRKLGEKTGLTAIQVDQWFRQQRYKKRHHKGVFGFQITKNDSKATSGSPSNTEDIKPLQDIKYVELARIEPTIKVNEAPNSSVGIRTRRRTSLYQAGCTNMNPASLVKIEMNHETDSESRPSRPGSRLFTVLNDSIETTKLPSPVQKSREHTEFRRTYSRSKQQQDKPAIQQQQPPQVVQNDSPPSVLQEQRITNAMTYTGTKVPLPLNLVNRFSSIRAMNLVTFQKNISKLSLKFDDLVETYVLCDEESKDWIEEETGTLRNIIDLHEKSSLVFTCEQEDILIERRLKILNELLRKRPTDPMWCGTVNSFHLENVFRTWYFLGAYCTLSGITLGDGIAEFTSKLKAIPNGPTLPEMWLIPPVLEP